MLTVTDSALQHLHDAITHAGHTQSPDSCFRIVPRDGNALGLAVQVPEADDKTFEYEGATVLALPEALSELCSKRTLDVDDGGRLILV